MRIEEPKLPTPEEIAEMNKSRLASDAKLAELGSDVASDGKITASELAIDVARLSRPNKISREEFGELKAICLEAGIYNDENPEEILQFSADSKIFDAFEPSEREIKIARFKELCEKYSAEIEARNNNEGV